MMPSEWIDAISAISDGLEEQAKKEKNQKIDQAVAFCDGYTKCCEDFARFMRSFVVEQDKKELDKKHDNDNENKIVNI